MSEQFNIMKDINGTIDAAMAHVAAKRPEQMWMMDIQKAYWDRCANAHDAGKLLVLKGACVPAEIIAVFNGANFLLDMIPTRLAGQADRAHKYIDLAEKYLPATSCGIDKVDLGVILSGDFSDKPDAFIYTTMPCDSARTAYPAIDRILGVPSFCLDVPFHRDERGYRYMAEQYMEIIKFMEKLTGKKMDWDRMYELIQISNRVNRLETKVADLRKLTPCPLPSNLLVLNEMIPALAMTEDMEKFLQIQYELGKSRADKGEGFMKRPEQFRVTWLQNMLWSNVGILDWMEKTYGAVVVMDAFGHMTGTIVPDEVLGNPMETLMALAKREMNIPMIHGAGGPVDEYIKMVDNIIDEFSVNVSMFVGHVGCKHTWAAGKIIKDYVYNKYGIPTLTIDVDAIDNRYKSTEEIRSVLSEYFDTLLENKEKMARG